MLESHIGPTKEQMKRSRFKRLIAGKADAKEFDAFQQMLSQAFDVFLVR